MHKRIKKSTCPNCGTHLLEADNFCSNCGQENHTHKLPLKEVLLEFLESFFHFDTKIRLTLRDLFVKPGSVTKNFNDNKRVRYVPPFRFYLFTSAIYFIVLSASHSTPIKLKENNFDGDNNNTSTNVIIQRDTSMFSSVELDEIYLLKQKSHYTNEDIRLFLEKHGKTSNLGAVLGTKAFIELTQNSNTEPLEHKILKNISYLMFLFMPFFALLLYLIFYKKNSFYSEHLIFSVHYHTVVFIILLASLIPALIFPNTNFNSIVFFICVLYLFLAVKHIFQTSWGKTLWKTALLVFVYLIFFGLGVVGAIAGSLVL